MTFDDIKERLRAVVEAGEKASTAAKLLGSRWGGVVVDLGVVDLDVVRFVAELPGAKATTIPCEDGRVVDSVHATCGVVTVWATSLPRLRTCEICSAPATTVRGGGAAPIFDLCEACGLRADAELDSAEAA